MEKKVFSIQGEEIRTLELADEVFNRKVSDGAIYYAICSELANCRLGTACTKTRAEVKGTSRKPWKQKGTGRARAGRRRSPVWVGGGIVFGPRPRDYSWQLPRKLKRLAMKSILSLKVREDRLKIVEDFSVASGKTRDLKAILKKLAPDERTVIVLKDDDVLIKRAGANLPLVRFLSYNRLRAHDLFYGRNILVLETAAQKLNDFYSGSTAEASV
ncbi:MAG: 50S ribosomal protein L4 [Spirochaetales bacterium]|jgi:large subunit ribosomal protein L4|nr:50S ribosomal protein L4 [Spirochaetales bacterium]